MPDPVSALDDRLTLEEVLQARSVPPRDCRDCAQFSRDPGGLGFGWCGAHKSFVKLYHPSTGEWHSQCQFKTLRQVRAVRPGLGLPDGEVG